MRIKISRRFTMYHICLLFTLILAALISGNSTNAIAQTRQGIKLVLQVTIDGLRADLINRYEMGFGKGGFRFLMEKGTYFTNAHYQYANTETIVGLTTLATGTFPSQHGMVGNVWFDREAGELAYNIEDPDHQKVHRLVHPVDVAPTIAALLGITPPGLAQGSPLKEIF